MATQAERLYITLEARLDKYTRDMNQAQSMTNTRLSAIERRYAAFTANLKATTSSAAMSLSGIFAGLGGALVSQQLIEYANAWVRVGRAVDGGQQTFGLALKSGTELTDLANEARIDVEAYAKTYVRAEAAIRDYNFAAGTGAQVTSTLAKALKLGGAAASEQASTVLQFSQALQKGKLDGDEFRTVMENAGVVQELLAERLGVSKGAIIEMAAAGKLQVRDLVGAMVDGKDKIDRIFSGLPATIDEAYTVLRNNIVRYIGQVDQATGASQGLVNIIGALGRNIDTVANAAATLGIALLSTMGGGLLKSVLAVASRLASFPAILAGGSAAALTFGSDVNFSLDLMNDALRNGGDLASAMRQALSDTSPVATTLSDQFRGLGTVLADDLLSAVSTISQALGGQAVDWDKLKGAAVLAVGAMVGFVKTTSALVVASVSAIPPALTLAFQSAYNSIVGIMQSIVDTVTDGINKVIDLANQVPGVDMGYLVAPEFDKYDTSPAVEELSALGEWLRNTTTEAADLAGTMRRVQAEADKLAFNRAVKGWEPKPGVELKKGVLPGPTADPEYEKARKRFDREMIEAEGRLRAQQLDQASIGKSTFETERLRVENELLNQARAAGVALTDADRIKIEAISNAMAGAIVKTENMRAAYQLMADETKTFFADFARGLKDGESATGLLADGLDRIANKLIDMAVNDLVNSALGSLTGMGGPQAGADGGLVAGFASLFGFAKGGVMVPGKGPASLPRFAKGGVSRSAAIFAEAGPEAAVPLPDGRRIPVDLRMPEIPRAVSSGAAPVLNLSVNIDAKGATAEGVKAMSGDLVPQIQKVVQAEVAELFDRNSRFARSGV
jgi:tape measure domain-containing protein